MYRVKITTVDFEHTCDLSPASCHLALKVAGKLIPHLPGLQDVLSILCEDPNMDYKLLCCLLQKYVPFYQSLDGAYFRNVCLLALNYVDNTHELTMVEACALTANCRSAADEFVNSDNPIFAKNSKIAEISRSQKWKADTLRGKSVSEDQFVVAPYLSQLSQQLMMAQAYITFDDGPWKLGYRLP
jgi:hypothetical protein